jgi:capsular polysaccharide transport system ATP-binding protein
LTAWFGAARGLAQPKAVDRAVAAVDLVQEFHTANGVHRVLDGISFRVGEGERLAVLGRNGAGKSTLIKVLAGLRRPTSGHVHRGLRMSWPLALGGGFEGEMSGYDNLRFISRIYGAPLDQTYDFVMDFSELGRQIHEPVRHYSDGMRMRLAFALSLAIEFECLLIDEVLMVGDQRFQQKCMRELFETRRHCGMILAIHSMEVVKERCNKVLVLQNGRGRVFEDVHRGCDTYATL